MELPDPTDPLPQLFEYHFHEAPAPKVPPDLVNVVELPEQTVLGLADALDGAADSELTVTITPLHSGDHSLV